MASLTDYFNSPELTQAQGQYQQAAGAANQSAAEDVSLPSQLRAALAAKFGEDNPLIQQRTQASTDYLNSIPSSYNDVLPQNNNGIILSPTQQAMMISAKQNAYLSRVAGANQLISSQGGNLRDLIESAAAAHQGETKLKLSKADLAHQNYADILGKLSAQADQAYKQQALAQEKLLREQEMGLQAQKFSFDMLGGLKGVAQKQLSQEVAGKTGLSLKDALSKYGNQLKPDEIFAIYNTSSGRGVAKETPAELLKLGIKPPYTNDELARIDALKPAQAAINSLTPDMIKLAGPQNKTWNQFSINHLGGLGVDQKIVSANQTFQLMKQNVVRALQGARMSDQDIKLAQQYIPDIGDTPATVKTKLANLQTFINSVNPQGTSQQSSSGGRPPLSSFNK